MSTHPKKQQPFETDRQAVIEDECRQQTLPVPRKSPAPSSRTQIQPAAPLGASFAGNIQGIAAHWETELYQIGRQTIGQVDSKIVALQAVTSHANRMANCLEILVEHLEQVFRMQTERQQKQMAQEVQAKPSEPAPATITESVLEAVPLDEMLQELADDLECLHRAIKRSTTFDVSLELEDTPEQSNKRSVPLGDQPEPANARRPSKRQGGIPEISFNEICREAEMLMEFGLEPREIAKHLGVPLDTLEFLLQISQNVDIIP